MDCEWRLSGRGIAVRGQPLWGCWLTTKDQTTKSAASRPVLTGALDGLNLVKAAERFPRLRISGGSQGSTIPSSLDGSRV